MDFNTFREDTKMPFQTKHDRAEKVMVRTCSSDKKCGMISDPSRRISSRYNLPIRRLTCFQHSWSIVPLYNTKVTSMILSLSSSLFERIPTSGTNSSLFTWNIGRKPRP